MKIIKSTSALHFIVIILLNLFSGVLMAAPKPVISFYNPASPCAGEILTIQGSGFTNNKRDYIIIVSTRNPARSPGYRSYSIRSSDIRYWSPTRIKILLSRSHSAYLKSGYNYRIQLQKKIGARRAIVATGPQRRLRPNCLTASDLQSGLGGRTHTATLHIQTLKSQVTLGSTVLFTGTITADTPASARAFRAKPMKIQLRIQPKLSRPTANYVVSKNVMLRGSRVSFFISGVPKRTGHYILVPRGQRYPYKSYGASGYSLKHTSSRTRVVKVVNLPVRQQIRIVYRAAKPMQRAKLGRPIFFGGTFVISNRAFIPRASAIGGAKVRWKVKYVSNGRVIGQGVVTLRKLRNPFIIRVNPPQVGDYYLELRPVANSMRYQLSVPNLKKQAVKVKLR